MRHHQLARATLAVAAVFGVAAIVFAGAGSLPTADSPPVSGGPEPASPGAGAVSFQARCGRCHNPGDFAGWAREHPDPTARGQWLGTVLQAHFPPPEDERAAIVGYIQRAIDDPGN